MTTGTGYMTHKKTTKHQADLAGYTETQIWSGRYFAERNRTMVLQAQAQIDRANNRGTYKVTIRDPNKNWKGIEFQLQSFAEKARQVINIPGFGDIMVQRNFRNDQPMIEFDLLPI